MKYENKRTVDTICKEIDQLDDKLSSLKNSIGYLQVAFHKTSNNAPFLDAYVSSNPTGALNQAAREYFDKVVSILESQLKDAHARLAEL